MIARLVLLICALFATPGLAFSTTYNAASCSDTDFAAVAVSSNNPALVDGDTVHIPTHLCPSGSPSWTNISNVTKAITIEGDACTLDVNGRPTSCPGYIKVGVDYALTLNHVASKFSRISNLEMRPNGGTVAINLLGVDAATDDGWRVRIDHDRFIGFTFMAISDQRAFGVLDHSYCETPPNSSFCVYFYQPASYTYADQRWADATDWGTDKFFFMENSTFARPFGASYAIVDAYAGGRIAVRFNDIDNQIISAHGTESGGRARGTRATEVYNNNFTNLTLPTMVDIRSGPVLEFGNAATSSTSTTAAAGLDNERTLAETAFSVADGTNLFDKNDAGNPFATFTASSASTSPIAAGLGYTQTVTVTGAGWDPNQWADYNLHKIGCITFFDMVNQPCGLYVFSNTPDTITYTSGNMGTHLDFVMGDEFTLNKVTHVFDAPCRARGTLLTWWYNISITRGGTGNKTATVTTYNALSEIGIDTGSTVAINDADPHGFKGVFVITKTGDHEFTYQMGADPGGDVGFLGSETTPVPWTSNDQITDACYQWLNTVGGSNVAFTTQYPLEIRPNEHYYDYSASFNGTVGMGSGIRADRPASTTNGVAWWDTDHGGNWNTLNGSANDGCLDIVQGGAWVNCVYTPYPSPWCAASPQSGDPVCADTPTPPTTTGVGRAVRMRSGR